MDQRIIEPEVMDDPSLDAAAHRAALRGLRRLNAIGAAAGSLFTAMKDLMESGGGGPPLRVLDLATGGGDVAVALCRRARRAGLAVEVHGCDLSPVAVEFARDTAERAGLPPPPGGARFFRLDAVRDPLPDGYDVVICSLFLHHLKREDAVAVLAKMAGAARRRVVVSDPERRPRYIAMVWLATRLLSRSAVVHTDGPRSVRAAFTIDEARAMAEEAGLRGARIHRCFPCRFILAWDKP